MEGLHPLDIIVLFAYLCVLSIIGYEVSMPLQMISYLTAGLIGAVIGALVTKPQPKEQLDPFFKNIKTSVETVETLETDTM